MFVWDTTKTKRVITRLQNNRKVDILNVQLVKNNFGTRKVISLNLQLVESKSQTAKSNLQLVILFPTHKKNLQLVTRKCIFLNSHLITHNLQPVNYKTTDFLSKKVTIIQTV